MKLFKISQTQEDGYDTYDSAVVAAPDEAAARNMNPSGGPSGLGNIQMDWARHAYIGWCKSPDQVTVEYLGETDKPQGVICASFNAG